MSLPLFLGQANGGGLYRVGVGGESAALPLMETWGVRPAGEEGDCAFRTITLGLVAANGYDLGITPILDGEEQPEQLFHREGAVGRFTVEAPIALRGTELAARVDVKSRTADLEFETLQTSFTVIRTTP